MSGRRPFCVCGTFAAMGDFEDYSSAQIVRGKTAPLKLNMLPRSPVVHVEFLGESNVAYHNEQLAESAAGLASVGTRNRTPEERKSVRDKRRATLVKHAIRKLEATFSDGSAASNADIEKWCKAIPDDVVDLIWVFCHDADNFREHSFAAVAPLAEK